MTKTDYKLQDLNNRIAVYKDKTLKSHGFTCQEDALHSIWIMEDKVQDDFYVADRKGSVSKIDRGVL